MCILPTFSAQKNQSTGAFRANADRFGLTRIGNIPNL